jgi:hypothetical protein
MRQSDSPKRLDRRAELLLPVISRVLARHDADEHLFCDAIKQ